MAFILCIGIAWAICRGFENTAKQGWNRGKSQKTRAAGWWSGKTERGRIAKAIDWIGRSGARVLRGIGRSGRHFASDFGTGFKQGWSERNEAPERIKAKAQAVKQRLQSETIHVNLEEERAKLRAQQAITPQQATEHIEQELKQIMSTITTGEAVTYEAAVNLFADHSDTLAASAINLESAISSLRSAGCNGGELEQLANAMDYANAAADMITNAGAAFTQRHGAIAEAMSAAGGREAVANDASFYVQG